MQREDTVSLCDTVTKKYWKVWVGFKKTTITSAKLEVFLTCETSYLFKALLPPAPPPHCHGLPSNWHHK